MMKITAWVFMVLSGVGDGLRTVTRVDPTLANAAGTRSGPLGGETPLDNLANKIFGSSGSGGSASHSASSDSRSDSPLASRDFENTYEDSERHKRRSGKQRIQPRQSESEGGEEDQSEDDESTAASKQSDSNDSEESGDSEKNDDTTEEDKDGADAKDGEEGKEGKEGKEGEDDSDKQEGESDEEDEDSKKKSGFERAKDTVNKVVRQMLNRPKESKSAPAKAKTAHKEKALKKIKEECPPSNAGCKTSAKPRACSPTCQWTCTNPKCEQTCQPMCAAPVCRTFCEPMKGSVEDNGCHTVCKDPTCTIICPRSCTAGNCPKCRTVCGPPMCTTKCNSECVTKCAEPICNFHCQKPHNCPQPQCSMSCNAVSDCLSTGQEPGNIGESPKGYVAMTGGTQAKFANGVGNIVEGPKGKNNTSF
mmetsp:Transcript_36389/g.87497  ORF Transcript_36389/g.87497 Transcript_36389/m.87497 type:complete len:420 (-) Transcript_36389:66-1325(-)